VISNSVVCNLGVAFDCGGTISSLTVTSADINPSVGSSGTFGRMVGLASLAFCTP
jgi:hypothetical protein